MNHVILVEHLRIDDEGKDHIKTIGIYRTVAAAQVAVDRLKNKPGFRDNPNIIEADDQQLGSGFYLSEYPLDEDNWAEGFGWEDEDDDAQPVSAANAISLRE